MPVVTKDGEFFIGKEIYTLSHQRYYTHKKPVCDNQINNKVQKLSQDQRDIIPEMQWFNTCKL